MDLDVSLGISFMPPQISSYLTQSSDYTLAQLRILEYFVLQIRQGYLTNAAVYPMNGPHAIMNRIQRRSQNE